MVSQRVFHPLVARLGIVAAVPAGVTAVAFGPVAAVGVGAGLMAAELWRVRRLVVAGMPEDVEFAPSRPVDHPWLDEDGFRRELTALGALGFQPLADYRVTYPGAPKSFARMLVNPAERVYAEVNQSRQAGLVLPVATTMTSALSDGWSLQTSSREAMAVSVAFMRAPKLAWRSMVAADCEALLADHLELRSRMCRDLGLTVGGDGTTNAYFALQREAHRARRDAVRGTNVVTGIRRGLASERRRPSEWLGSYSPA